jgi:hypothetical protein
MWAIRPGAALAALLLTLTLCGCGGGGPAGATDTVAPADVPEPADGAGPDDAAGPRDAAVPDDSAADAAATDAPAPDAGPDPRLAELIAQGRARLSAGESLAAMDSFGRALSLAPGERTALWGLSLARFQSSVAMFGALVFLANMDADPDAPAASAAFAQTHAGTVGVSVDGLLSAGRVQQERLTALLAGPADEVFVLEGGLPLALGGHELMTLCCAWDRGDLYALSSWNELLLAFARFLGSQDSDVSFDRIMVLFRAAPGISSALAQLLDEYPALLALVPEGGAADWQAARTHLAAAAAAARLAAATMAAGDAGASPVATLAGGAAGDAGRQGNLVLHGRFPSGATELEVLWDGRTASLRDTVERTAAHLGGDAAARLSLEGDVLVAVGVLVDVVNRTVGLPTLLAGLGFEPPAILGGFLAALDPRNPEQLVGMLPALLPVLGIGAGTVEIDLLTFLEHPADLRDFFPHRGPVPGSDFPTFRRSFECPRAGWVLAPGGSTTAGTLYLHDPSATEAGLTLEVTSYAAADATGDAFDAETLALAPVEGFTGLYEGGLELAIAAVAGAPDDGALTVPQGGAVRTTYTSAAHPEAVVTLVGAFPDGLPAWDYGAACADATRPWDAAHFGELEFATAVEVPARGETAPLQPIPADGARTRAAFLAFGSPSFGGLLWIDDGDGPAPADQARFAGLLGGVLAALEAF